MTLAARTSGQLGAPAFLRDRVRSPSLWRAVRSLEHASRRGAELERDLSDATAELFTGQAADSGTIHVPLAGLPYAQVLDEVGVRTSDSEAGKFAARAQGEGTSSLSTTQGGGGLAGFTTVADRFALALTSSIVLRQMPEVAVVPVVTRAGVVPAETAIATTTEVAENGNLTSADPTLAAIPYTLQKVSAPRTLSNEIWNDLADRSGYLQRILSRDLALRADLEYLEGSGAGTNIKGIRNTSGLSSSSWAAATNGSTPGGNDLEKMSIDIYSANAVPTAMVMAPRTAGAIGRLTDGQGQYLFPNLLNPPDSWSGTDPANRPAGRLWGARVYLTTSVPITETQGSSGAATHIIYGDFSKALVVVRQSVELRLASPDEVLQMRLTDGNVPMTLLASDHLLLNTDATFVIATLRTTVVFTQPTAFAVATGII